MADEVVTKFVGADGLQKCEKCEYEGGFHVTVHPLLPTRGVGAALHLKCPHCGQVYNLGLVVQQAEGWK